MAGDGEADVDLDSILAAARQRSPGHRGGRSPVYELMWDHHARLLPELGHPRRPNWAAVAQALGDQGVLDGAGQALGVASAETVRKTWWKVCRDKEVVAAGADPAGGRGMLPPGGEQPPRREFEFLKTKDWTKEADKGDD